MNRSHLLASIFGASILLVPVLANAQSPVCKGMEKDACLAKQLGGVNVCSYIPPRQVVKETGLSEIKGYCRVSLKKITDEQAKAITAELGKTQ